ncbi:MAG: DUF4102 domain-containing protein [Proteobacteria bacterium]|nr:MAG: DUF4102 domain-containing protein [Pseudomonadota bacterium]
MQVRNAKPREKAYKLADGGGLYLEITSKGGKLWRVKFRQRDDTENRLSFGVYPEVWSAADSDGTALSFFSFSKL